jgi:CRISPR/Cas system CSM-associated protein Csm3 (group 7 of RAMP superfamily)
MIEKYSTFHIARLVLETVTPLSISTGRGDGLFDNLIVCDANGLPAIPGSSFAGVLRHLFQEQKGKEQADNLFGRAWEKTPNQLVKAKKNEWPSQIQVSWGCIHDSNNQPVEGILLDEITDSVLKDALDNIVTRDHVRINHRGAADAQNVGKFDRSSLRAGHRFSIELSMWRDPHREQDAAAWHQLLDLLTSPGFRLGGATRRGLGAIKVKGCYSGSFDLADKDGFDGFCQLTSPPEENKPPRTLALDLSGLTKTAKERPQPTFTLVLQTDEPFRFGGGTNPLNDSSEADNMYPVTERKITWKDGKGHVDKEPSLLIPASSIKGAISHRTAFYYNALRGKYANSLNNPDDAKNCTGENNEAVKALFGFAKDDKEDKNAQDKGRPGCILFEDVYLPIVDNAAQDLMHNGIDRFTGGVREGVLYTEEVVNQHDTIELKLAVLDKQLAKVLDNSDEAADIKQAFVLALEDLANGRLALGAGSGRGGMGYFSAANSDWKSSLDAWVKGA